jgi:hypothetical protein
MVYKMFLNFFSFNSIEKDFNIETEKVKFLAPALSERDFKYGLFSKKGRVVVRIEIKQ